MDNRQESDNQSNKCKLRYLIRRNLRWFLSSHTFVAQSNYAKKEEANG